jgi:DNA-binding transcriptional regulator PaaX
MRKYKNTKHFIIASLVPFTDPNLKLIFKPSQFFKDMSALQNISENAARNAFYRLMKSGMVQMDDAGIPHITKKGLLALTPYTSKELKNSRIMVIFDIPEQERWKRRQLRSLLRELSFTQVQKSVWVSKYDSREYIKAEVQRLELEYAVFMYEARKI